MIDNNPSCEDPFGPIADEFVEAFRQGKCPSVEEFARRYPEQADEIRDILPALVLMEKAKSPDDTAGSVEAVPRQIGRYRVEHLLGKGGFGLVYLAHDEQLQRPVAIKVPHAKLVAQATEAEAYLTEARAVANLDHPNIVAVHDVGSTEDCPFFIVSKYIDGTDLATRLRRSRLPLNESVELVATVAEALHHAHKQGLVHRDIKPGNLLLDKSGKPFVADFGMALREQDVGKGARYAGTPAYMSPEQARGEGHRVDGRSDIFSLGVVFYELLVGRPPFQADSQAELLEQVTNHEPRPLRQIDDGIPKELERICFKALSKRASERYLTAKDMADDLRHWSVVRRPSSVAGDSGTPAASQPTLSYTSVRSATDYRPPTTDSAIKIVPKGLRSFDGHDADFFLELLPGPRDREGLPDSIRFWKMRIEEPDADSTFTVGLIYGPSGCGKSSLVKAGLLPRLSNEVLAVYVEATAEETEARLLNGLRKRCPALADDLPLKETLATLRQGQGVPVGKKVLIVLDQFEQWLHAKKEEPTTELVQALRQCDGRRVQCIVMVRDDFWLAVSRFLRDLEIRLVEGHNSALADLFDLDHARKVLSAFGRAFGKLPENPRDTSKEQQEFLKQAVSGLAQEGKVISVRLALFAEMMKGKAWTPSTLKEVGGTQGVGTTFLEETFSAATAPPEHCYHQKAARGVLKALLPESGTDIKGHMRSYGELLEASGYAKRSKDFDDLVRILDGEIRLMTPTDPEGKDEADDLARRASKGGADPLLARRANDARYYQLTHDYLVHSLREWLTRKQRETRSGRALLRLEERAAIWTAKPENRHLPSVSEWADILLRTNRRDRTAPQRRMMHRAGLVHGLRAVGLAAALALLVWTGLEIRGSLRAEGLIRSLRSAATNRRDLVPILRQIDNDRRWAEPGLKTLLASSKPDTRDHLHASLALLPTDPGQADYLLDRMLTCPSSELALLRDELSPHRAALARRLWTTLEAANSDDPGVLRAASALAGWDATDARWDRIGDRVADALVALKTLEIQPWLEALQPVRAHLRPRLAAIFRDAKRGGSEHTLAADILVGYAADAPSLLANLLLDAEPKSFRKFLPVVELQGRAARDVLEAEIKKSLQPDGRDATLVVPEDAKDALARRQARAIVALARLGDTKPLVSWLVHRPDPRVRSFLINWLELLGADPRLVAAELNRAASKRDGPAVTNTMDAILFDPATSRQRALILALGQYSLSEFAPGELEPLATKLLALYRNDPDAGIHGAASWALRQWGMQSRIEEVDAALVKQRAWGDRRWYINGQGQTFMVTSGPVEFTMGSPRSEPGRAENESSPHRVRIAHRFAIADREVSIRQYDRFANAVGNVPRDHRNQYSPDSDGPANRISWFAAAQYCNWLSEQEGIPRDQWCYEPNAAGAYAAGMRIAAGALGRTGYRLSTEPEWEYACRAGAVTSRFYGHAEELLSRYAWYLPTSPGRAPIGTWLRPNDVGLFDMLGKAWEWSQDSVRTNSSAYIKTSESVDIDNPRILRGGSFLNPPANIRSAYRNWYAPTYRDIYIGFRVARTYH